MEAHILYLQDQAVVRLICWDAARLDSPRSLAAISIFHPIVER